MKVLPINRNRVIGCHSIIIMVLLFSGCTGINSFGVTARSGDTVALALGWQKELKRQDLQVTVTDSNLVQYNLPAGDPAIRALINTYPDPVSNLIVGSETGQNSLGGGFNGLATSLIDSSVTNGGKDYTQTFLLLDIPSGMSTGMATIEIADQLGNPVPNPSIQQTNINPISIEIIPGVGASNDFGTQEGVQLLNGYLVAMERAENTAVTFQSAQIPYAIEINFQHNPDADNGGVGKAYAVPPRGDFLNITWFDDGASLKAILIPSRAQTFSDIGRFKFYIAGGVTGLSVQSVTAFDIDGFPVANVTASLN